MVTAGRDDGGRPPAMVSVGRGGGGPGNGLGRPRWWWAAGDDSHGCEVGRDIAGLELRRSGVRGKLRALGGTRFSHPEPNSSILAGGPSDHSRRP
jgi:hypothetical protein